MRNKKGEVKGDVSIGNNYLVNKATATRASKYFFINFADGAITVWEFLARRSGYEWSLTEFKIFNTVFSKIISTGNDMEGGSVMDRFEVDAAKDGTLSYWVSVHSHPKGGNELSDNGGKNDDITTWGNIRKNYYPNAQMNTYDYAHIYNGYNFIKNNRK
jgi:hypothetical protein